jgi:hypothetical protein
MTIDKNQIGNESVKPQTFSPRPELGISTKNHASTQTTDDRILSNLGSESITKQSNGRLANNPGIKIFSLLGVSTIAAYAAFSGYQYLSNPASNNTASGAQNHNVPPTQPVVLAAPQPVAPTPSIATSTAPEAAQIVNAANPVVASLPASAPAMAPDTLTRTLEDGVPPPTATLEKALAAKTPTTAQLQPKQHSRQPATHLPSRTAVTAKAAPAKEPSRLPEPAVDTTDEDVNLLAALIAHSVATPAPPPKPAVEAKPKTSVKAAKKLEKEKQAAKAKAAAKKE